jgi:hypothetical protein
MGTGITMSWVDAIKAYAEKSKGKFSIPKRDSPEYAAVRKIQEEMAKGTGLTIVKPKKKKAVAAVAPVVEVAVVAAPKVTKPKVVKRENQEPEAAPEPKPEVKVFKKSRVVPKPAEKPEVVEEAVVVPETKVKVVRRKVVKRENQEPEPAPEPVPEVKKMTTVQEERAAKRAEKHARLEEQSKKAGEHALAQARVLMTKSPVILDFS